MQTRLAEVVAASVPKLRGISEAEASVKPGPAKWSKKEILGHLIDSAANNHQRFVRLRTASEISLPGYEQDEWVAAGRYQSRAWNDIIALWEAYNRQLAVVIEGIDEAAGGHVWHHPEADYTLEFIAADYVTHQLHHLRQIAASID